MVDVQASYGMSKKAMRPPPMPPAECYSAKHGRRGVMAWDLPGPHCLGRRWSEWFECMLPEGFLVGRGHVICWRLSSDVCGRMLLPSFLPSCVCAFHPTTTDHDLICLARMCPPQGSRRWLFSHMCGRHEVFMPKGWYPPPSVSIVLKRRKVIIGCTVWFTTYMLRRGHVTRICC